jgi:hypothetical protein
MGGWNLLFIAGLRRRLTAAGCEVAAQSAHPGSWRPALEDPRRPGARRRLWTVSQRLTGVTWPAAIPSA